MIGLLQVQELIHDGQLLHGLLPIDHVRHQRLRSTVSAIIVRTGNIHVGVGSVGTLHPRHPLPLPLPPPLLKLQHHPAVRRAPNSVVPGLHQRAPLNQQTRLLHLHPDLLRLFRQHQLLLALGHGGPSRGPVIDLQAVQQNPLHLFYLLPGLLFHPLRDRAPLHWLQDAKRGDRGRQLAGGNDQAIPAGLWTADAGCLCALEVAVAVHGHPHPPLRLPPADRQHLLRSDRGVEGGG